MESSIEHWLAALLYACTGLYALMAVLALMIQDWPRVLMLAGPVVINIGILWSIE